MRVWIDPQKTAERRLSASDVVTAIRAQNVQAAAGAIGSSSNVAGLSTQLSINAQGRLQTPEEFGEIVVRTGADDAITRLRDVARTELGASDYSLRSLLSNKTAAIFQSPGSNAIQIAGNVRRTMTEIKQNMPDGVTYEIAYDTTQFVRVSIIPLVAVPVSIVGTFGAMHLLGFSINALSLFGLVLASGIVVVKNVERNFERGLAPREAAYRAMSEVSGPIVAIALVLVAVFVPLAFISGLTGQSYRQFALTVAISTVISAINSLTLPPALAGVWLTGGDNNVFTQIGLIVLVGLSAKNAILIVEFARELEFAGRTPVATAIEASRLRLRPILMTSMAFIMGVVPLVLCVTAFGLFLIPVFYVALRRLAGNQLLKQQADALAGALAPGAAPAE